MLFASFDFLLFLVPVLAGYFLLSQRYRARCWLLLLSSYFFYCASARPPGGELPTSFHFVGLLMATTFIDFWCARVIEAAPPGSFVRRLTLAFSVVTNLGLLGYFKYTGFLLEVAGEAASLFGAQANLPMFKVALPIGISFYTFQSLSYTIDVYRGRLPAERSLLRFSTFIAFFPQLVAGPIVRAVEFLPQLGQRLIVTREDVDFAVQRICGGLFKKVVLGDYVAANFADLVFATPHEFSSAENLLALYAFTLQIYADFSGYSDIAIGVARLFGFRLPENFDRPYQAAHVGEFWRRWHMTLSTWLRDYLFFPLGGSRGSVPRVYFNLWLTMFLVGMWHGASWNFVIYGNLQAVAMLYNRYVRSERERWGIPGLLAVVLVLGLLALLLGTVGLQLSGSSSLVLCVATMLIAVLNALLPSAESSRVWTVVHVFLMFHFTTLSRVFFRADSLEQARVMSSKLLEWDFLGVREGLLRAQTLHAWLEQQAAAWGALGRFWLGVSNHAIGLVLVFGLAWHFTPKRFGDDWAKRLFRWLPAPALGVVVAGLALLIAQLLAGPRANIYFAF